MLPCTTKEVFVKQTTFNNILDTEVSSKLFYCVFPTNSLDKASELLFIFVCVHRGYTPFPNQRDRFVLVVYKASTAVSPFVKPKGKVIHKV